LQIFFRNLTPKPKKIVLEFWWAAPGFGFLGFLQKKTSGTKQGLETGVG
jgi:hypothetical protein